MEPEDYSPSLTHRGGTLLKTPHGRDQGGSPACPARSLRLFRNPAVTNRWLILADDLTGAADSGIAFARRGLPTLVAWGLAPVPGEAPVVALDAGSRSLPAGQAADRHAALLRAHGRPSTALFKKMDSTLRGQPAAEIAAMLSALRTGGQPALAVVAPAFPATGRTTEGGRVRLAGAPLEESALWERDHSYPSADVPAVLASAGIAARLVGLVTLRNDAAGALQGAIADGVAAVVCDAVEQGDLEALAHAGLGLGERLLWAGSGGLAAAIASALPRRPAARLAVSPPRGGALVVVGSRAASSRAAVAAVERDGVATWDLPPAWLEGRDARIGAIAREVSNALAAGQDVLVRLGEGPQPDSAALAVSLAAALAPALEPMGSLFATGGDTARALLDQLGARSLRLVEEVEPGVPLALAEGARRVLVVTKAGAFGDAGTIRRSLGRLRELTQEHHP
ncbi:MAG: four-carbon acid sugar kinase family protein [Acetobacteraceae bacterium]|nr:four-carbon acid sugar kinase family protein [Acetobacteraceae bacterium]